MGLHVSTREPGPPPGLGACTTRIERLRIGDLANLWAESGACLHRSRCSPRSKSARSSTTRVGSPRSGAGSELARRAARVPALTRRVLWTRPGQDRPVECATRRSMRGRHMTCSSLRPGEDLLGWAAVVDGRRLPRPAARSSAPAQVEPMGNRRTAPSPSVKVSPPRTADSGVSDPSSSRSWPTTTSGRRARRARRRCTSPRG
jgi:hypothetical protein